MGTDKPRYLRQDQRLVLLAADATHEARRLSGSPSRQERIGREAGSIRASTPNGINSASASATTTPSWSIRTAASGRHMLGRWRCARPSARPRALCGHDEQQARDDWPRSWRWLGPAFGDYAPLAVVAEDLFALRGKVAERVSESEAFRVIKVWRAVVGEVDAAGLHGAARI